MRAWLCLVALFLCLGFGGPLAAQPLQCPDPLFSVEARDADFAQGLCSLASEIRDILETCGLAQRRALSIEVVDELSHPLGSCLAYFDCDYDLIRLSDPSTYGTFLEPEDPYSQLPGDVQVRALLTHELSHALATHSAGERRLDIVDQEYIAAAMELDLMEPEFRSIILEATPIARAPSEGLIDIWIYGFAPRKFAVNAWRHFRAQENGCELIRQIVAGEKSFAKALHPELR
jgi:hypothetical protein